MKIRRVLCWSLISGLGILFGHAGLLMAQEVKNIAALQEGGHLAFFSSQFNDGEWKAENLLDGSSDKGWAGQGSGAQSVIIAFKNNGLAEIHDVLINPYTREDKSNWAKDVEIQVSMTYPFRDFRPVGKFTLKNEGVDQVLSFPAPTQGRYVKVRFLNNYGGSYMEAGEVQVMGKWAPQAPPAPTFINVAAAAKGARIEKYTSQFDESGWAVKNLLEEDGGTQWAGKSSGSQEVVIALPEVSDITDISINNYSRESPKTWAKDVEVEISATLPYKGFTSAGKISMPQVGDLHTISLPAPSPARYVRVFFRTNYGGSYMEAARIRVYKTEATGGKPLAQQLAETGRAVVHEIHFGFNSAEILPGSEIVLNQIARLLQDNPKLELIIEGHTDNVGGATFNLELSRKRAEAVKRWLVDRKGISEVRLTTAGYGLSRPIADNGTEQGRAQNRRVELARRPAGP
jgi:outer membrane protein OmpA-like peptidoglycan-associated protein